jgi:NADPH-dependent ferric siderophore reductase
MRNESTPTRSVPPESTPAQSIPTPSGGVDMTADDFLVRVPDTRLLDLRVVGIEETGTAMRAVRFASDDLAGFSYAPGQDLMVLVDTSAGRIIRRRYTIRRVDAADNIVELDVITDSDGPGGRWARGLAVGDRVEGIGPRGKITLADGAAWHLFVGDDVAVPAFAAMIEALPPSGRAIVVAEVAAVTDEAKIDPVSGVDLRVLWHHRDGAPPGDAGALVAAANAVPLPDGPGHAYVFAEASVVNAVRDALIGRGLAPEQISPKAYWGRGRANASHGEPLKA